MAAGAARGGALAKAVVPARIAAGALTTAMRMRRDRPSVVVGFGGYPTIPAMAAARMLNLPRMLHEQNGVLGRVNQLFAKHVHVVACGSWPTDVPEGVEAFHVGNPVRAAVRERAGAPYIPPGDYPMSVLVIGGSQGARILSDVVPEGIARLPQDVREHIRVHHQAREEDVARVEAFYAEAGISADVRTFFTDIPTLMAEAQLVIARSGASTIADLTTIGRPAILVPFAAAAADHQTANARQMVAAGAAVRMPESKFTAQALAEHMETVLCHPTGAGQMAQAALSCGMPDATERLVALVETLAGGQD